MLWPGSRGQVKVEIEAVGGGISEFDCSGKIPEFEKDRQSS
jgi:hypothetical protein